jgi:solute carrier family 6 GABA transporter-like protein 1
MGFIIGHFLLVWCIVGFMMPNWLDVFIIPERRDDWKQPIAPGILRDTTEGEVADRLESGGSSSDVTEGKKEGSVDENAPDGSVRRASNSFMRENDNIGRL